MLPEISRRCVACGAAIRASATFCHQCGKPVYRAGAASSDDDNGDGGAGESLNVMDGAGVEGELSGALGAPLISESPVIAGPVNDGPTQGLAVEERADAAAPTPPASVESSADEAGAGERSRAKLQRARAVARGAMEERVAPRVEKLRQTSAVVLDEAADDPGLRFVLVAAVLIILSVLLFLFSRLIG